MTGASMNTSDSDVSTKNSTGFSSPEIPTHENPPRTIRGILGRLGPGMIIAGSIVGSGELIATTLTGATAGFWLLWLIIVGCVIKVFVQVEFGRFTISSNQTTMAGLNEVPGPVAHVSLLGAPGSRSLRGNWLLWYWALMFVVSLGQLGGIVGGVGQALAISLPLTDQGRQVNELQDTQIGIRVTEAQIALATKRAVEERDATKRQSAASRLDELEIHLQNLRAQRETLSERLPTQQDDLPTTDSAAPATDLGFLGRLSVWARDLWARATSDDKLWAGVVTLVTVGLLVRGRYGLIQTFSTILVASFTLVTILNLFALQAHEDWAIRLADLANGLSFRLTPEAEIPAKTSPLVIALATFGIIGVGANELIAYPYWCQEKGYARFTGPRDDTPAWAARAHGWMRVMQWDAWCSMIVYTFATVAFYLLGAAILGRIGLVPAGMEMVRTLGVMYEPVFGSWAKTMFLFGAFAVLYSTFFVANAGHARIVTDALGVLNIGPRTDEGKQRWISAMCVIFPTLAWLVYVVFPQPTTLVLAGGAMQAFMLPMLATAALYFRYWRCDPRLRPGRTWDCFLWISAIGLMITGGWLVLELFLPKS
jgi:Mn2+/Fe2+ NRAMP family transporter